MDAILTRYADDGSATTQLSSSSTNWTSTRGYLYRSWQKLTLAQVTRVLDCLDENFPNRSDLQIHILQSSPRILRKNVKTNLQPTIDFLKSIYSDEMFILAVQRNPDLLLTSGMGYDGDDLDLVEVFLRDEFKLSDRAITNLKSTAPALFQLPISRILTNTNYLKSILRIGDLSEEDITKTVSKVVVRYPSLLNLSENNLKARMSYLKEECLFEDADLAVLVRASSAAVLGLSVEVNLKPTIGYLKKILLEKDLRKCVLAHPQILGLSLSNLRSKVEYFDTIDQSTTQRRRSVGLASRVLSRAPAVYSLSLLDNIIPKVDLLAGIWGLQAPSITQRQSNGKELIFVDETRSPASNSSNNSYDMDLAALLGEDPSILTLSLEANIRPTINFFNRTGYISLDEDWKLKRRDGEKRKSVLRSRYISASLFNRLLPRWHFCYSQPSHSSQKNASKAEAIPLHILVGATDRAFCEFIGQNASTYSQFKAESIPRLKFSSQFDTWLRTGHPIDIT